MSRLKGFLTAAVLTLAVAAPAGATSITVDLNCLFSGVTNNGACTPGGSYGTLTVADNVANDKFLDITVDLLPEGGIDAFLKNVYFNVPAAWTNPVVLAGVEYEWAIITPGTVDKITYKLNDVGSGYQYLDLEVQQKGTLVDPWTGTIALKQKNVDAYYDLGPLTFANITNDSEAGASPSPSALVSVAVFREVVTHPSSTFTMVGSLQPLEINTTASTAVPEPTALVLVGIGLAGLGVGRSRRRTR